MGYSITGVVLMLLVLCITMMFNSSIENDKIYEELLIKIINKEDTARNIYCKELKRKSEENFIKYCYTEEKLK